MKFDDIKRMDEAAPNFRQLVEESIDWHRTRLNLLEGMAQALAAWQNQPTDDPLKSAMQSFAPPMPAPPPEKKDVK